MEYTEIKCALAKAGAHFLFFRKKKEIFCAFLQNKNFFKNFVPKSRFCVLYIVKKHPQRQAPHPTGAVSKKPRHCEAQSAVAILS